MATKLLLTEDVDALGRKGEVVIVKPGYARNFLLPTGKGLLADANALRKQKQLREERLKQAAIDKKDSDSIAVKLKEIKLECSVKVDKQGHLYGSVTAMDLYKQLEAEHGIVLGKRDIQLKHPIKKIGLHIINVKLKEDVETTFSINIIGEGYVEPEPVPEPVAQEKQQPSEETTEEEKTEE